MSDPSPLDQLTDRQKQCLRLLWENLSSKEIGRRLGMSPHTVNAHLRTARDKLALDRSMDAARLLIAAEGYKRSASNAVGIETAEPTADGIGASHVGFARNRYNLGPLTRLCLIVATAFIAVALAGASLTGAEAVARIFWDHQVDISDPPYWN